MVSSRAFRGSRQALALVLSEGPRTASELAGAMDKPTGSIFGVLTRMVADGIVVADTGAPTRGTRYSLAPDALEELRSSGREPTAPGTMTHGQQLLLVDAPKAMTAAQRVLAQEWISGTVSWAAEVGGGWLLALDAETSYPAERLMMALEHAGVASRRLSILDVLSGSELRDRASWLLDDVERFG